MKKILILSLLFFSLGVHAQIDSTNALSDTLRTELNEPPDSTDFGSPDGQLVSKEIGSAGGTIISDDGRVELIFPADALTANTTISIQPTSNPAPNGAGKAYQFEPSGIQFKKPVQIIFHYSEEEAKGYPPDLMALAIQDHNGQWSFFDYDVWDSSGKKLTGEILHFSYVSNVKLLAIKPKKSPLHVGRDTEFVLWELTSKLKKQRKNRVGHLALSQSLKNWAVNNIPDGDETVGIVGTYEHTIHKGESPTYTPHFYYTAPRIMPLKNPVMIETVVYLSGADGEYSKAQVLLSCKVEIYDEYVIGVSVRGAYILDCGAKIKDDAVLTVKLYAKKIEFTQIENQSPVIKPNADCGHGSTFHYDTEGCVGPINLDIKNLKKWEVKNYPPEVTIEFIPKLVKVIKSRGKYPEETTSFYRPEFELATSIGNLIQFIADRQLKELPFGTGEDSYTVTIAPI